MNFILAKEKNWLINNTLFINCKEKKIVFFSIYNLLFFAQKMQLTNQNFYETIKVVYNQQIKVLNHSTCIIYMFIKSH